MGLRRLLTRQPAEDPLERLAELGRETGSATSPLRTGLFAEQATRAGPAMSCVDRRP
jgi:hypothetical protein